MKETQRILNSLVACGVALAMVSTLAAQSADQGAAKIIHLKGAAQYKVGNGEWRSLKYGDVVRQGTVIQTAGNSRVDLLLGDASVPVNRPAVSDMMTYQPTADQNVVRMWENTLMSIDTLTRTQTGADEVTDTQLDLKAGHITGSVKKMSAASKYNVKLPIGVASIRGTVYDFRAEGLIKVLSGAVVLNYTSSSGSQLTQDIMGLQMFDARTGTLSPLPDPDKTGLAQVVKEMKPPVTPSLSSVAPAPDAPFISPH